MDSPLNEALLRPEYTIETPESVSFRYPLAGIGSRFIGALIDTGLILLALALLNLLLYALLSALGESIWVLLGFEDEIGWAGGLALAVYALLQFVVFWGYYMVFELIGRGQTPGKRVAGTRVIAATGEPPGFAAVAVRNLVRIVDLMPAAYAIGLVTMLLNDEARRLGDWAAGTVVVRAQGAPESIAAVVGATRRVRRKGATAPAVSPPALPGLRRLAWDDRALARDALQSAESLPAGTLERLAAALAVKLQQPPPADAYVFLYTLANSPPEPPHGTP